MTLYKSVDGKKVLLSAQEEAEILSEWERNIPNEFEISKEFKLNFITSKRNEALKNLTTTWDGDTWDANEETANRIASALTMIREAKAIGIPTPPAIPWRTYDNKDRILTIEELTQMGAAVFLAQQEVWAKQAQVKNNINNAATKEEVEAITWED